MKAFNTTQEMEDWFSSALTIENFASKKEVVEHIENHNISMIWLYALTTEMTALNKSIATQRIIQVSDYIIIHISEYLLNKSKRRGTAK